MMPSLRTTASQTDELVNSILPGLITFQLCCVSCLSMSCFDYMMKFIIVTAAQSVLVYLSPKTVSLVLLSTSKDLRIGRMCTVKHNAPRHFVLEYSSSFFPCLLRSFLSLPQACSDSLHLCLSDSWFCWP